MKLRQLLAEGPLAQAFQKGMQSPGATIKQAIQPNSAASSGGKTATPAARNAARTASPYDNIPSKSMKDIIKRVLSKQELETYQIKLLTDLDRQL